MRERGVYFLGLASPNEGNETTQIMKRQILELKRHVSGCCPGHDDFPDEAYRNRRSIQALSRSKALEHRLVRRVIRVRDAVETDLEDGE